MARHKSAKKRARQDERRRLRNRQVKSRVRKAVKEARAAVGGSDAESIRKSLAEAERELRRAASKGVIPKKRASRSVSRLARSASRAAAAASS